MKSNKQNMASGDELEQLREENRRLKKLLSKHGIPWEPAEPSEATHASTTSVPTHSVLTTTEKVALFSQLFRGRTDVYPIRWESSKGKSGYSPACANEWHRGVCHKPGVKCGNCNQRLLKPLTNGVIYDHLAGNHTVGIYPLIEDNRCYFLAADFDDEHWQEDAKGFMQSCRELDIRAALEISRSGNGAHVWIFFSDPVPAREARQLGAAIISHTCERTRQLSLTSYDRLFPNQDTLPKGGFGNLIALPLQKQPREHDCSVFVDEELIPYSDQWSFLRSIRPVSGTELADAILRATGGRQPLDVSFAADEEQSKPWQRQAVTDNQLPGPLPESLHIVLANQIFLAKAELPQPLSNRLIRLAAFQNPEFYKAQAMRLPVWNKPRIIGCAENFSEHIGLPRGCLDEVLALLKQNNIIAEIKDERGDGCKVSTGFTGKLRKDQNAAVKAILKQETGVLCAPTAFGKTVTAAAIIARRKRSTLILVHRTELLRQWQERLTSFLDLVKCDLGIIGAGKKKPSGQIDIAVMQSLSRIDNLSEMLDNYGQIIIDECHHISAFSFETILKQTKSKYILGLTATPIRRDGRHPIIFMQCGPIRHTAKRAETAPSMMEVIPQYLEAPEIPPDSSIQEVFRILAHNSNRNYRMAEDVKKSYEEGRKILVLTERTDHLELLRSEIENHVKNFFVLHGRQSKKQRAAVFDAITELGDTTPHVILSTGRLIGEGFDHPPLDTLVLAMPISWKGTLQQYAGRLHREHSDKDDIRVYDYVEIDHPQLSRMWDKRLRGYRAMGYEIKPSKSMPL